MKNSLFPTKYESPDVKAEMFVCDNKKDISVQLIVKNVEKGLDIETIEWMIKDYIRRMENVGN